MKILQLLVQIDKVFGPDPEIKSTTAEFPPSSQLDSAYPSISNRWDIQDIK
jgi:hypothetical protein